MSNSPPKPGENVWLWLLKILTGVLVFTLLIVHLIVNHLTAPEGLLTYKDVAAYLSNPWVALMETSFLIFVVSHALLGARSIILDFKPKRSAMAAVNWLFLAVGIVSIVYGIWLIRTIASQGAGG